MQNQMMNKDENRKWRKLIFWLHKNFPADLKIRVRSKHNIYYNGEKCCSLCTRYSTYIRIDIEIKQTFQEKVDSIIHEWAHALSLTDSSIKEHPQSFGIAFAKIYEVYSKWNVQH